MARSLGRVRRQTADRGPRLTDDHLGPNPDGPPVASAPATILQGDRRKAYRPIPPERRRAALDAGLAAYERGDFFEAHELLEPAWMGTSDLAERALYQGVIKLAAGYVHAVRGNPIGFTRNLRGARTHLETSQRLNPETARRAGIDVGALMDRVDDRISAAEALVDQLATAPEPFIELLPGAPPIR